ncbi:hypothetical protein MTP99_012981 [Tenebrio molitor]|jgi:hypothetical protein|nr:hypothetical protein MTP99_012981 [Tenebrio molitor]
MAPLQFSCINICGIARKYTHLKNFLTQDKISVVALTETHATKPISLPKFHCYQRNSEVDRGGGVALRVADKLASSSHPLPNHLSHIEAVAANLYINNSSIVIISYYNRPNDKVSTALLRYASQLNHAIVLGDFNARHTDFGDTLSNPNGRLLNSLLIDLPLCRLHNTSPIVISHQGCYIPDHILINENLTPIINLHCNIGTTVSSDHIPLTSHFLINGPPPPPEFIPVTNFKEADWRKFQQFISENLPNMTPTIDPQSVDIQVARFTETLKSAQLQSVPRKFIPMNKRPIPARILSLIRDKRRVYREFVRTRNPNLKTIFNQLNAQVRRDLNQFREDQWSHICQTLDYRDGKSFWSKFQALTRAKKPNLFTTLSTIISS